MFSGPSVAGREASASLGCPRIGSGGLRPLAAATKFGAI